MVGGWTNHYNEQRNLQGAFTMNNHKYALVRPRGLAHLALAGLLATAIASPVAAQSGTPLPVAPPIATVASPNAAPPQTPSAAPVAPGNTPRPVAPAAAKPDDPPTVVVTAAPGKGLRIATKDGSYAIGVRARVQMRDTFTHTEKGTTNELNIKTARLFLTGNAIVPELQYFLQFAFGSNDFEKDNASPIFDAYLEYTKWRDLNVRVGQFFVPFDRARTTREFALQLVDRQQIVQELSLDRDVGIMLSSSNLFGTRVLGYNLFVGGGEGRNRFGGQAQGPLAVMRLTLRPFGVFDDDVEADLERLPKSRLAISVAGAYNHQTNRQKSTLGNTLELGTLDYTHGAADLVFKYAGFSLLAETLVRLARLDHLDGEVDGVATREWSRSGWGYFVQAGMMLNRRVELAARWDQLSAFSGTDPTLTQLVADQGKQIVGGLNVYLNGHFFKLQTDYTYAFGSNTRATKQMGRLQLDVTF